ncbi:hypothetical protein [Chitinophaga sp. HK235]|uniref:hypothetical protein n=1 Tax=Chitinophaga sp. HK235 TaxID=2952571 RepID=UPI001BA9158E|nr:hypothetical protein [Chitinophaga sp. HK235]
MRHTLTAIVVTFSICFPVVSPSPSIRYHGRYRLLLHAYADFQAMLLDGGFDAESFCTNSVTKAEKDNGNDTTDINILRL